MRFSQTKFTLEQMETIAGALEQAAMEEGDNVETDDERVDTLYLGAKHFEAMARLQRMEERRHKEHVFKMKLEDQAHVLLKKFPGLLDDSEEVSGADLVEFLSSLAGEK